MVKKYLLNFLNIKFKLSKLLIIWILKIFLVYKSITLMLAIHIWLKIDFSLIYFPNAPNAPNVQFPQIYQLKFKYNANIVLKLKKAICDGTEVSKKNISLAISGGFVFILYDRDVWILW